MSKSTDVRTVEEPVKPILEDLSPEEQHELLTKIRALYNFIIESRQRK